MFIQVAKVLNKYSNILSLTVVCVFLVVLVSCSSPNKNIKEGIIEYEITYLQDKNDNPIIGLMPSTLKMIFKDNSTVMEVESGMGLFKSKFIRLSGKDSAISVIKVMGDKFYCLSGEDSEFMGMPSYKKTDIDYTNESKEILGYKCKHAKVNVTEQGFDFNVYYTTEINIESPNRTTPLSDIEGVLLDFYMEANGLRMHLQAKEIKECEINDNEFFIPKDYKKVEKQKIEKVFRKIM